MHLVMGSHIGREFYYSYFISFRNFAGQFGWRPWRKGKNATCHDWRQATIGILLSTSNSPFSGAQPPALCLDITHPATLRSRKELRHCPCTMDRTLLVCFVWSCLASAPCLCPWQRGKWKPLRNKESRARGNPRLFLEPPNGTLGPDPAGALAHDSCCDPRVKIALPCALPHACHVGAGRCDPNKDEACSFEGLEWEASPVIRRPAR